MEEITDDAARLELNLGAGTKDAVYFRNASLKAIGIYKGRSEEDEKEPVKGGEHIYNGTFDQGNNKDDNDEYTRLRFWNTIGTITAKVDKDQRNLRLSSGATQDAGIEQRNVQLLGKDTYQISFAAVVDTARNITVRAVGNDDREYVSKTIELPAGSSRQSFTFDVPKDAAEKYGKIQFIAGADKTDVVLDNISMKRLTNYNVDYSDTKVYPLSNGSFVNGLQNWNPYETTEASVSDGVCTVIGENTAPDTWRKMLVSDLLPFAEGLNYELHFEVKADKADQPIVAQIQTTDNSWHNLCNEEFTTTTDWKEYDISFVADRSGAMEFKFILGGVLERTEVKFRNISLHVANTPVKQAPDMNLEGVKREGEDVVIPLSYVGDTEAAYKTAEKKIIITDINGNSETVDAVVDNKNNLVISKDVFAFEEGNYIIRILAEGFDYAEFDLPIYPGDGNLIMNGKFSNGLASWGSWFNGGEGTSAGTISVTPSKESKIDFLWANDFWDLQMSQDGISTEAGSWYIIQADVRSTLDRPFRMNFAEAANNAGTHLLKAGSNYNTYTFYCQATKASSKLEFFFGSDILGPVSTPSDAHSIYVDNVVVKKMSSEDLAQMIPDVVSKGSIKLTESAEFTLSNVKDAWSKAEKTVYVDNKPVKGAEIEGTALLIPANVFKQTGYYEIVIKAEGFPDTNVAFQRVLSPAIEDWIENGDFSHGGMGWTAYQLNEDNGGVEYKEGKAVVTVDYTSYSQWGALGWTTQLIQKPTGLEVGKNYVLTFQAATDLEKGKNFEVQIKSGNETNEKFTLTQEAQTFTVNFTPQSANIEIGFFCGNTGEDLELYGTEGEDNSQSVPAQHRMILW